jgi:hypothetical protein
MSESAPDRRQLSVRALMAQVLVLALAFNALIFASEPWAGAVFLVTLGSLVLAILGIGYRRGAPQAFWVGFALFGWSYAGLVYFTAGRPPSERPPLVATWLLDYLRPYIQIGRNQALPALTGRACWASVILGPGRSWPSWMIRSRCRSRMRRRWRTS